MRRVIKGGSIGGEMIRMKSPCKKASTGLYIYIYIYIYI